MSNATINIEFLAGTTIHDAVTEAKEKAGRLDLAFACFDFNGVSMSIGRNADINEVAVQWSARMCSKNKYNIGKIVCSS